MIWSFDRAINEVFRLLPQELCPRPTEEQAPAKPLSGIEHLMELHVTPLLMLPQSKLVENTMKFLQNKLNSEKCGKDWLYSPNLISSLALTKFYSLNQYFPKSIFPNRKYSTIRSGRFFAGFIQKGRCSIPVKNLEAWEKRARKLVAINSHTDWFSSAAYLCLQQQFMSVAALSRLLEAVAKSIKHAMAMSTILATELFQARRDAALATSKLLLEKSCYELRNAPINAKSLFDNKIN